MFKLSYIFAAVKKVGLVAQISMHCLVQ